mmetsp:Transcript_163207/g.523483  ORF Transcript_163207/g.523483 Transcript_163207/m.523483 type:complete len:578 (+) Transcript_163207:71-1804(+)
MQHYPVSKPRFGRQVQIPSMARVFLVDHEASAPLLETLRLHLHARSARTQFQVPLLGLVVDHGEAADHHALDALEEAQVYDDADDCCGVGGVDSRGRQVCAVQRDDAREHQNVEDNEQLNGPKAVLHDVIRHRLGRLLIVSLLRRADEQAGVRAPEREGIQPVDRHVFVRVLGDVVSVLRNFIDILLADERKKVSSLILRRRPRGRRRLSNRRGPRGTDDGVGVEAWSSSLPCKDDGMRRWRPNRRLRSQRCRWHPRRWPWRSARRSASARWRLPDGQLLHHRRLAILWGKRHECQTPEATDRRWRRRWQQAGLPLDRRHLCKHRVREGHRRRQVPGQGWNPAVTRQVPQGGEHQLHARVDDLGNGQLPPLRATRTGGHGEMLARRWPWRRRRRHSTRKLRQGCKSQAAGCCARQGWDAWCLGRAIRWHPFGRRRWLRCLAGDCTWWHHCMLWIHHEASVRQSRCELYVFRRPTERWWAAGRLIQSAGQRHHQGVLPGRLRRRRCRAKSASVQYQWRWWWWWQCSPRRELRACRQPNCAQSVAGWHHPWQWWKAWTLRQSEGWWLRRRSWQSMLPQH